MPKIEVQLFQIPCVKLEGKEVSFPFKRVDALFYYLICRKTATRQELVDLLWEDCAEEVGYKNLRHTIYTLRKVLGSDLILTVPKTEVRLNPAWELVSDFDRCGTEGTADTEQFLRGFTVKNAPNFNAWVDQMREQMAARTLNDLSAGAAEAQEKGDLAQAERLSLEYLSRDGLDEKMVMFLMKLYQKDGRYYKAANLYQKLKDRLAEELGIAPLHETAALYYDIVNRWNETTADDPEQVNFPLAGSRSRLLQKIQERYQSFQSGYQTPSLLFYGESGCGKSYLLQHFLRDEDFSDVLVLTGHCSQLQEGVYLEPWKNVMLAVAEESVKRNLSIPTATRRTIARVFPVFSDEAGEQREACKFKQNRCGALVTDAVALLLSLAAAQRKILLVFEDLQWMDPASQDLLCQVVRRLGGGQLLLLASSRTLNVDVNFMLDESALERVCVPCFTKKETDQYLDAVLGADLPAAVRSHIYEATGGNPRLLAGAAENLRGKEPTADVLPDANEILRQRMAGLSTQALHLANVLALFPDKTPCRLLSEITGYQTAQLYSLSVELEEHSLIGECCVNGESYLEFLHPHMREALYQVQSYFQRQPLHLKIADCLQKTLPEGDVDALARAAHHCRAGGDSLRAFRFEAASLYWRTSWTCEIPPLVPAETSIPAPLPDGMTLEDEVRRLEQELDRLRRQYPSGPQSGELDKPERMLLCAKARMLIYTGQYQEGLGATETLLQALTPCAAEDTDLLLWVLRQRIAYSVQTDQPEPEYIVRGLEIAEESGLKRQRACYLLLRGIDFCKEGSYKSSDYFFRQSLGLFDHPERCPMFCGYVRTWQGEWKRRQKDFAGACELYQLAVEQTEGLAPWPGSGFLFTCYGRAAMALGDDKRARQMFARAMEVFEKTEELPGRSLAEAYTAYYAAQDGGYASAVELLKVSWDSASKLSSLVEQGIRDSVLARLRRQLDQEHALGNELDHYLYRPLDIYCHRGMQRLRGVKGAYEYDQLEDCLKYSVRQAKPLTVENLYSKNKNFMTE